MKMSSVNINQNEDKSMFFFIEWNPFNQSLFSVKCKWRLHPFNSYLFTWKRAEFWFNKYYLICGITTIVLYIISTFIFLMTLSPHCHAWHLTTEHKIGTSEIGGLYLCNMMELPKEKIMLSVVSVWCVQKLSLSLATCAKHSPIQTHSLRSNSLSVVGDGGRVLKRDCVAYEGAGAIHIFKKMYIIGLNKVKIKMCNLCKKMCSWTNENKKKGCLFLNSLFTDFWLKHFGMEISVSTFLLLKGS